MYHCSSISLCKFICRHQFATSSKLNFSFFSRPLIAIYSQRSSHNNYSKSHYFNHQSPINSLIPFKKFQIFWKYGADTNKKVDIINLKFAEAREDTELAMDSKETVYFNEESKCAREVVGEVLESYEGLLKKLPDGDRVAIQRAMGLKIEQSKAELEQLNE